MELKNLLTPWNWFKKEEEQRQAGQDQNVLKSTDHPLSRLHHDLDTLFDQMFQGVPRMSSLNRQREMGGGLLMPHVDIGES